MEILGAFLKMTGTYPVGSLLLLSDGSLGVVVGKGQGKDFMSRPKVNIVSPGEGGDTGVVDLAARDRGLYVVKALDPYLHGININRHIV